MPLSGLFVVVMSAHATGNKILNHFLTGTGYAEKSNFELFTPFLYELLEDIV